jgi:hypothetical protein
MVFKNPSALCVIKLIMSQTPQMGRFVLGFRELLGIGSLLSLPFCFQFEVTLTLALFYKIFLNAEAT